MRRCWPGSGCPLDGHAALDEPGGSGLGLAIAKTLAELHGGTVAVEDHAPTGNTFVVDLPTSG